MYSGLRATSDRLIARFGATATLTAYIDGDYNAETGAVDRVPQEYSVPIIKLASRDQQSATTNIEATMGSFLVTATVTPKVGDRLEFGPEVGTIIQVERVAPGNVTMLFRVQVRAGAT